MVILGAFIIKPATAEQNRLFERGNLSKEKYVSEIDKLIKDTNTLRTETQGTIAKLDQTGKIMKRTSNSVMQSGAGYVVGYRPLSQKECMEKKDKLGLKYCPYDNDHLAGAVAACGGIDNMPTMKDLLALAKSLYKNLRIESNGTSMYGERDDEKMKELGIWVNDSHIYYWSNEEAKDGVGGYVRMFASRGSIPYYAPRDGSGYVSRALGKVNYGKTKHISTFEPCHNSNLVGLPNEDVLLTICNKRKK
jgi:hypothetical protein